jgi:hypothetical protein
MDNTERDRLARRGAEIELAELDRRREELTAFLSGRRPQVSAKKKPGRKSMSAEERKALSDKMKKKWEETKKGKSDAPPSAPKV